MEALKITKDIAIKAILFGACKNPKVGSLVSSLAQSDLIWAERMFIIGEFKLPIWSLSGYGSGDGGYGDGSGSGSGYGYGGYGDGDGDGSGSGDGCDGDGDGYGCDGYGSGGSGDGYGCDGKDLGAKILAIQNEK